jgi:hypothetical protein
MTINSSDYSRCISAALSLVLHDMTQQGGTGRIDFQGDEPVPCAVLQGYYSPLLMS